MNKKIMITQNTLHYDTNSSTLQNWIISLVVIVSVGVIVIVVLFFILKDDTEQVDVIWFAGQSNQEGQNSPDLSVFQDLPPNASILWADTKFSNLQSYTFNIQQVDNVVPGYSIRTSTNRNMVKKVCVDYINSTSASKVLTINTSLGSTGFDAQTGRHFSWLSEDDAKTVNYSSSVSFMRVNQSLRQKSVDDISLVLRNAQGNLKALIWFQGENLSTKENYETLFEFFRTTLDQRFPGRNYLQLPIVIVQTGSTSYPSHIAQVEYASNDVFTHLVDLSDLYDSDITITKKYRGNPIDKVHFSADALTNTVAPRVSQKLLSIL